MISACPLVTALIGQTGSSMGVPDSPSVGLPAAVLVGCCDGVLDGDGVGPGEGFGVGFVVGELDGGLVGTVVGSGLGDMDGSTVDSLGLGQGT